MVALMDIFAHTSDNNLMVRSFLGGLCKSGHSLGIDVHREVQERENAGVARGRGLSNDGAGDDLPNDCQGQPVNALSRRRSWAGRRPLGFRHTARQRRPCGGQALADDHTPPAFQDPQPHRQQSESSRGMVVPPPKYIGSGTTAAFDAAHRRSTSIVAVRQDGPPAGTPGLVVACAIHPPAQLAHRRGHRLLSS